MLQNRIQREFDFLFVIRRRHGNQIEARKDGHVLASSPDATYKINFLIRGELAFIMEIIKVALPLVGGRNFFDIVRREQLFAVEFAALKNGRPDFNEAAGRKVGSRSAFGDSAGLIFPVVNRAKFSGEFRFKEILGFALGLDVQDHHDQRRVGASVFVGLALGRDRGGGFK